MELKLPASRLIGFLRRAKFLLRIFHGLAELKSVYCLVWFDLHYLHFLWGN